MKFDKNTFCSFKVLKTDDQPLVVRGTLGDVFDKSGKPASRIKKRKKPIHDPQLPTLPPLESHLNLPFRPSTSGLYFFFTFMHYQNALMTTCKGTGGSVYFKLFKRFGTHCCTANKLNICSKLISLD